MSNQCTLCANISGNENRELWNQPIFESHNFVVLPSLGALVEGWLLIIPRKHFICAGAMPPELVNELHELKNEVAQALSPKYGSFVAFEHGPNRASCDIGCGVDHAHLHLVPFTENLEEAVMLFLPENTEWMSARPSDCSKSFTNSEDYLYFEQPLGFGKIARGSKFKSQLFRKAIASSIGLTTEFNWRESPQLDRVFSTIEGTKDSMQEVSNEKWQIRNLKAA